jgi:hypothetical protein
MRTYAVTHSVDLERQIKENKMGRPLHKKYFGNRNIGSTSTSADDGIGGQGVASITIGSNDSAGYAANDPLIISAPQLPGGVQAVAKIATVDEDGKILTIEVTEKGSGYTSAPTVTEDVGGVQGNTTFTAVLTTDTGAPGSATNQENAIAAFAFVTGGSNKLGDIVKQVSSRRYKVKTADGTMVCELVTDGVADAAGEMTITATDSAGGTYFVKKLTARRAVLVRNNGTQFATGASVKWTFGAAVEGSVVTIANA